MAERDREYMSSFHSNLNSSGHLSQLNSKQLVQSHIKSIMPSLKGGKQEVHYLFIRVQQKLEAKVKNFAQNFQQTFGEYLNYKTFKEKKQLLQENVKDGDLYYIFVHEDLSEWTEKFSKQEREESKGKKIIHVISLLSEDKHNKKINQRSKLKKDPNFKIFYEVNRESGNVLGQFDPIIRDMQEKLAIRLRNQGDKVKNWALSNKFAHKKKVKKNLHFYIEKSLNMDQNSFQALKNKKKVQWIEVYQFKKFSDIIGSVDDREDQMENEKNMLASNIMTSRIIAEKSQLNLPSSGLMNSQMRIGSTLSSNKSIPLGKKKYYLSENDSNIIICGNDHPEIKKLRQYVKSHQGNQWRLLEVDDDHLGQIDAEIKKLVREEEDDQEEKDRERIIKSRSLYIFTFPEDHETIEDFKNVTNNFCNMELIFYEDPDILKNYLHQYARDLDNFIIVVVDTIEIDQVINEFLKTEQDRNFDSANSTYKNSHRSNNIRKVDKKRQKIITSQMSMKSNLGMNSNFEGPGEENEIWLREIMMDRDNYFHPFGGLQGRNVYLIHRYDRQNLIDDDFRNYISQSRRLQKSTYIDGNYLNQLLKTILKKDSAIILTEDSCLREAQEVVKNFNEAYIMNITNRKNMKDEIKVMAWGPKQTIYGIIKTEIPELDLDRGKKEYPPIKEEISIEAPHRILPKDIEFKPGNNITVRISAKQKSPQSAIMENRLDRYFKEEIKFEYYDHPEDIRLTNKKEQPLTFIICDDEDKRQRLDYMKKIAAQQKKHLRQEYILFTKNPKDYEKELFHNPKYNRFRFISNNWKNIEEYIIGMYEAIKGQSYDSIYDNELVHVFYHPKDQNLADMYVENFRNSQSWGRVIFHPISEMEEVVSEQSFHHLYYLLVNEKDGHMTKEEGKDKINSLAKWRKNIKMLLIQKDPMIRKEDNVRGSYENSDNALKFLGQTQIIPANYKYNKPYLIFGPKSLHWYYFLEKNKDLERYKHLYVPNNDQFSKALRNIRENEPGAKIWVLTSDKKEYGDYSRLSKNIERGRDIYFIFHGDDFIDNGMKKDNFIFMDPNQKEIEALALNSHKRSSAIFSPAALRNPEPIIAISRDTILHMPLNHGEMSNWKDDFKTQPIIYNNLDEILSMSKNGRIIYLILDIKDEQKQKDRLNEYNNIKRIVFDSSEHDRSKGHRFEDHHTNKNVLYFGHYPAEIKVFLKYLRYNIKNSPQKLDKKFGKLLTQIYLQEGLHLNEEEIKNLKRNHSIARIKTFHPNDLEKMIQESKKLPYNSLFVVDHELYDKLGSRKDLDKINYLTFDQRPYPDSHADLVTDERPEMVTYLMNLPEKRYQKAKNMPKKMKLLYKNDIGPHRIKKIEEIAKRNKNIKPAEYNIRNLKNALADHDATPVVLLDEKDEGKVKKEVNDAKITEEVNYFILGNNQNRNLLSEQKTNYFITKNDEQQLPGYLNNARVSQLPPLMFPTRPLINTPKILRNDMYKNYSKPLKEHAFNFNIFPPFKPLEEGQKTLERRIPDHIKRGIQNSNSGILNIPEIMNPDQPAKKQDIRNLLPFLEESIRPRPLDLNLDTPPKVNFEVLGKTKPDDDGTTIYQLPPQKPPRKEKKEKLAIIYPNKKEFINIGKTLERNLDPKYFTVDLLPFKSDDQLESYSKPSGQKILSGYDKILCFLEPSHHKYDNILRSMKVKLNNKLQYYIFDDDFHRNYPQMKQFLNNYEGFDENIPWINKDEPEFWLTSNIFNILVPINKKKKFDGLKKDNILVTPYKNEEDIFFHMHRENEFVIIVCDFKDYHKLKVYPRRSPRCMLVVQDGYPIKEDQFVLFRLPKKSLYYGPDAFSFLHKNIPTKSIPTMPQPMKILYYSLVSMEETVVCFGEDFWKYEKVPYRNVEELFNYSVDRFKSKNNFKIKKLNKHPTDLVRITPKLFLEQESDYHDNYLHQYSEIGHHSVHHKTFENELHPSLLHDLKKEYYKSYKDLSKKLDAEESASMVIVNGSDHKMNKVIHDFRHRHLFIQVIDLKDKWIEKDGDLTPFNDLAREQLAKKQILFTKMFSKEVFDKWNDMGYYYLSNRATIDEKRNIKFVTKETLEELHRNNPHLLMIVFVEHTDLNHLPRSLYNPMTHQVHDRVKLIFLKSNFVNHDMVLYVKFNEIDPVINHINKVENSGRINYCLYPSGELGTLMWHKFIQDPTVRNCENKQYDGLEQIDDIAQDIKGKFRKVYIICRREQQNYITRKLQEYSIKTKEKSDQQVNFLPIPEAENKSFINANSSVYKRSEMLQFHENDQENGEKFETVGHAIDIKLNSSSRPSSIDIEEVIENKNFVLSVNEKMRDIFPIGNFYASKVKYFKSLDNLNKIEPGKSQIIISNEKLQEIQELTEKNPETFVIYVSNQLATGQSGNTLIIKEEQIPILIKKLEGSKDNNEGESNLEDKLNLKNIQQYKTIKIVYDNETDKDQKKKILEVSMKNKNIIPCLFKDMKQIKELMKEDDSLVVLMMGKELPLLEEEVAKQNYIVLPKKKVKMLVPRQFDSAIDGLSTILEEQESQLDFIEDKEITESNINLYLNMIEKNPQKNKGVLMTRDYFENEEEEQKQSYREMQNEHDHENITKLNVHSNIRPQNYLDQEQIYRIRQRLDGGVIVVVVQKKYTEEIKEILKKYNILIQQYSHAVNLDQSIRDRKDKVTIVVVEKNMLESIIPIKKQFPRLIFILLSEVNEEIPEKYKNFISGEINVIPDIEKIIGEIYEENEKIKYIDQTKGPSRFDNRRVSTVDVGNSERFSVGFNNTRAKKAFIFYKDPENTQIKNKLSDALTNISFIPYKDLPDIQKKLSNYGGYQSILIANNQDIQEIEDYVAKKKDQIYIIRFEPPRDLKDNPKVKLLLSASSYEDLSNYLFTEFQRNSLSSERTITSKLYTNKNMPEGKKYVQKYEPNTFGTTPRFPGDFVPPKSKESTYSRRYLKSTTKTSKILRDNLRSVDSRAIENSYYP